MPEYRRTSPRDWSERVYGALLRAYPRDFREEFGDAMAEFFRDSLARARRTGRLEAVTRVWARSLSDLARNALPARFDASSDWLRRRRQQLAAPLFAPSLVALRREDAMWSSVLQDLRFALRGVARAPGFALAILAMLSIGIGSSVAVFSVVHRVLLRPLPYHEPQRIVSVQHLEPFGTVSEPEFVDYKREISALSSLAAYRTATLTMAVEGAEPERVRTAIVSEDFFDVLGTRMTLGREFTDEEERRGGPFAVVISHGLWQRRYAGDSGVIGRQMVLAERPRTIVGVMNSEMTFPGPGISVWLPLRLNYDTLWTRNNHYLQMIGRLADGSSVTQAGTQMSELTRRFMRDFPQIYDASTPIVSRVAPLSAVLVADSHPFIVMLFGAVVFVLLIACANVANLLLARGETRRRELAIRTAMGASRFRIVRQAFTESLMYAAAGGAVGVALAFALVRILRSSLPASVPRATEVAVDPWVLSFAVVLTVLTGLLFGAVPALRVMGDESSETLKDGGRGAAGGARRRGSVRRALVATEFALAVVTLSGAGLMVRSLWNTQAIDIGFEPDNVLAVQVAAPARYAGAQATALYDRVLERIRALPDVVHAGAVEDLPITDGNSEWSILIDGAPQTSVANAPAAMPQKVAGSYFAAMRIPVLQGRVFDDRDRESGQLVAVINESMAREHWSGKNPVGGTLKLLSEQMPWVTVIGVVKDVRSRGPLERVPPTMYFPQAQAERSAWYVPNIMWLIIRTRAEPRTIAANVRSIVRDIEPSAPIATVQTMNEALSTSLASRRFTTNLLLGFGTIALVLAGLGIYSVISYSVSQRSAEMGVRMALGASRNRVITHVMGEGVRTAVLGAAIGIAGALAGARLLEALVVGISPTDPLTLLTVCSALLLVAMLASLVPARRASGVDPVTAIRTD